jgi:hypothetical protein
MARRRSKKRENIVSEALIATHFSSALVICFALGPSFASPDHGEVAEWLNAAVCQYDAKTTLAEVLHSLT